ncbi:MAG: response regulator [Methanomassiliicoccales archaeon]|nr:response regulator [Methanomassiliicoccales archaeon]
MTEKNDDFLKRLRETFRVEANEHMSAISSGLFELEKIPDEGRRTEVIETIFREVHSLKGAARSVNLRDIEVICQPMEGAFAALKRGELSLVPAHLDLFHKVVDYLAQLVTSMDTGSTPQDRLSDKDLVRQLVDISKESGLGSGPETSGATAKVPPVEVLPKTPQEATTSSRLLEAKPSTADTVRIPISGLNPLLLQAEEMILVKMTLDQRTVELRDINQTMAKWKVESAKWKNTQSEPEMQERGGLHEWNGEYLSLLLDRISALTKAFEQDQRVLGQMVDDHLEATKKVLMLPVMSMMELFPRLVRDLSRDQGKETELVIRGAEIAIDKRILDELKDPLVHLVRNCIDHGIKNPNERSRLNKPPRGTITISFSVKDSHQIEMLVSDDGEGIDVEQVRAAAIRSGMISKEAAGKLSFRETIELVFQSGITTSSIITDLSGRGLGLAIVREKVEKLGGTVSMDTESGTGTTFHLLLPLSLTTFRGVLVRVNEDLLVLPTMNIERVLRVNKEEIGTVENRETVRLNETVLSVVKLVDVLQLPIHKDNHEASGNASPTVLKVTLIILLYGGKRIAFQVDEVLGEHQILVKSLGRQLSRVRNITGATVLGNGKVIPVLNVPDLMRAAVLPATMTRIEAAVEKEPVRKRRILVVEDSITTRMLIKNILEMAGYSVMTAVDGVDGFTQARSGEFDMIVSDIDMPRMNGFELTHKIRDDKKMGELPVVLVTALESREDRERGIEVGASAYIVKSNFDQSNLLEVVRKLI